MRKFELVYKKRLYGEVFRLYEYRVRKRERGRKGEREGKREREELFGKFIDGLDFCCFSFDYYLNLII